ncbi:hypothetical protein HYO62_00745 [Aerococcaceae bacterium DSM 111022]|nr:hypothetical protein [Aerococcaceae bacterium DSM 111022]
MVENKVDKELIAKHVGHSSTKMIDEVYGHFTSKMDSELKSVIQTYKII